MLNSGSEPWISSRFDGMNLVVETAESSAIYELEYLISVLLVAVARSDGHIDNSETNKMLELVTEYFHLKSAESLQLLTRAVRQMASSPDLTSLLRGWSDILTPLDKEDIAVMMLKIVAADGKKEAQEIAMLTRASKIIGIGSDTMHEAYKRYFSETDSPIQL
ncbi:MAG: TerB family tellurite resistance protein [Halioglobus sp.]